MFQNYNKVSMAGNNIGIKFDKIVSKLHFKIN